MSDKVYVVTSGEYSDYRIEAVYATRELAEAHVRRSTNPSRDRSVADDPVEVEEWPLRTTEPMLACPHVARVSVQSEDEEVEQSRFAQFTWPDDPPEVDGPYQPGYYGPLNGQRTVRAQHWDRDRALKAARDRAAKVKAEEAGL